MGGQLPPDEPLPLEFLPPAQLPAAQEDQLPMGDPVANIEEDAQEPVPPPPLPQQQNPFAAMQFMAQQHPPAQQQPFQQQPFPPPLFPQQPFQHQPFHPPAPAQPEMVMAMQYQLHQQNQQIQQLLLASQQAQQAPPIPNYYGGAREGEPYDPFFQDDQSQDRTKPFEKSQSQITWELYYRNLCADATGDLAVFNPDLETAFPSQKTEHSKSAKILALTTFQASLNDYFEAVQLRDDETPPNHFRMDDFADFQMASLHFTKMLLQHTWCTKELTNLRPEQMSNSQILIFDLRPVDTTSEQYRARIKASDEAHLEIAYSTSTVIKQNAAIPARGGYETQYYDIMVTMVNLVKLLTYFVTDPSLNRSALMAIWYKLIRWYMQPGNKAIFEDRTANWEHFGHLLNVELQAILSAFTTVAKLNSTLVPPPRSVRVAHIKQAQATAELAVQRFKSLFEQAFHLHLQTAPPSFEAMNVGTTTRPTTDTRKRKATPPSTQARTPYPATMPTGNNYIPPPPPALRPSSYRPPVAERQVRMADAPATTASYPGWIRYKENMFPRGAPLPQTVCPLPTSMSQQFCFRAASNLFDCPGCHRTHVPSFSALVNASDKEILTSWQRQYSNYVRPFTQE
jgi:hypothetical protein